MLSLVSRLNPFRKTVKNTTDGRYVRCQRSHDRIPLDDNFSLKVVLSIPLKDNHGNPCARGVTQDWTCKTMDISEGGLQVHTHPVASAALGERCTMIFMIDTRPAPFPCTIRHFSTTKHYAQFGVELEIPAGWENVHAWILEYAKKAKIAAQEAQPVAVGQ